MFIGNILNCRQAECNSTFVPCRSLRHKYILTLQARPTKKPNEIFRLEVLMQTVQFLSEPHQTLCSLEIKH